MEVDSETFQSCISHIIVNMSCLFTRCSVPHAMSHIRAEELPHNHPEPFDLTLPLHPTDATLYGTHPCIRFHFTYDKHNPKHAEFQRTIRQEQRLMAALKEIFLRIHQAQVSLRVERGLET